MTASKRSTRFACLAVFLGLGFMAFAAYTAFAQEEVAPTNAAETGAEAAEEEGATETGALGARAPVEEAGRYGPDPWEAVARIDNKIANLLIFLTIFAALIPVLVAVFEYFKLKEIEEFRESVPGRIRDEVDRQMHKMAGEFERSYSNVVNQSINEAAGRTLQLLKEDDIAAQQVLLSYLNGSDGGQSVQMKNLFQLFELQKSFAGMQSGDDRGVQAALQHLGEFANSDGAGYVASVHLLEYLKLLQGQHTAMSLSNRRLLDQLCDDIRKRHGIRVGNDGADDNVP